MNITQKRTCRRCKALWNDGFRFCRCILGYITEIIVEKQSMHTSIPKPSEPCPKPMNHKNLNIAIKEYKIIR